MKLNLDETFERIAEQGSTQAKKVVKNTIQQAKQTVSPSKMWEQILGVSPNHTPLDTEKLAKKHQESEKQKEKALEYRLFQLVKQGEEKILQEKKKEVAEKKQKEFYELERKKKEEEKKRQEQTGEIPQGKVRRSIFTPLKVAQRQHAELKPATGKQ